MKVRPREEEDVDYVYVTVSIYIHYYKLHKYDLFCNLYITREITVAAGLMLDAWVEDNSLIFN